MTNSSQMKETLEDIPDFPQLSDNEFTRTPTNIYINKTTKKQAKEASLLDLNTLTVRQDL